MNEERSEVVPGLRREWMIIVRQRRLVALGFFGAVLGTTIYNYSLRPVYEGLAVVTIAETIATNRLARMSTEMTRLGILLERQRALIKSPELAARVAPNLSPQAQTELSRGPIGSWAERMRSEWSRFTGTEGSGAPIDFVTALRSRLRVTGETKSTWLEIRFAAYDPAVAAEVANALMEQYLKDTEEANKLAVENSQRVLGEQVEEKEQRLTEQLSGLRQLGGRSGLGDLDVRKAMLEREYRAFQEALVSAQTSRVGREARRREATQLKGGVAAIRSDPLIRAASSRVTELEDKERALLATLGPEHPDVVVVKEQLEGARQRLAQEMGALEQGADSEYQLALNEESRLKKNMARIQRELADVEKEALGYSLERRKFEASRSSIETLLQRQANASTTIVDAQVLQSARAPTVPISPQRQRNFLYSLIGGLIGGLVLAWMAERFDDSVQSPEDVKDGLGLPFLGIVPLIRKLPPGSIAPAIADGKTGLADSLRVVRTNLIYGSAESRPKVLAFTSATPGEGKSTVAAGLAILFAQNKARVLLIDADMRRPTAHQLLNLAQSPGLSGILAAEGPVVLAPRSGPVRGLDVLTAGAPQELSAERLGSEAMKSVVDQARSRYDWVLIDSPPALGLSDAAVIATLVDGMVVVCSGDKTPRQAVRHVADQLRAVRASVLGVVLNRVDLGRHSYYYGRYYSAYRGPERHGGEKAGPATRETAVS